MKEDETTGWGTVPKTTQRTSDGHHGAPTCQYWHCPECKENSAVADWLAGEGGSRKCPKCSHVFAHDDGGRISEADAPGRGVGQQADANDPIAYFCTVCKKYHPDPACAGGK